MSSRNYSDFVKCVYNYLGYYDYKPDDKTDSIIDECYKEVCKYAQFKYKYAEFDFLPDVLKNPIYESFLSGCNKYIIGVMTLGPTIDSKIKHYSKRDLVKMCIFDSV